MTNKQTITQQKWRPLIRKSGKHWILSKITFAQSKRKNTLRFTQLNQSDFFKSIFLFQIMVNSFIPVWAQSQ